MARGMDNSCVIPGRGVKSVSNEITFNRDVTDKQLIRDTLIALSDKVGYRLRKKELTGKTVALKIRFSDFSTYIRHLTLSERTDLGETISASALELLSTMKMAQPVRLLGVGMMQVSQAGAQANLFDRDGKRQKVSAAMDSIKAKFGERSIQRGSIRRNPDKIR